jgi:hypothetical protein
MGGDVMRLHAVTLLSLALVSCGSVPRAPLQLDAAAKSFKPPSGLARIYVYRLGSHWFGRYDSRIILDREPADYRGYLGDISKRLYVFADVPPGKHTVTAVTVHYDEGHPEDIAEGTLAIDVVADSIYFVRVEVPGTWPVDPPKIEVITNPIGMSAVRECWLAQS